MESHHARLSLSRAERLGLDAYLAPFSQSRDHRIIEMASRCRQALNVREIALGLAPERAEIVFLPEELQFLQEQIEGTHQRMGELLAALRPDQRPCTLVK